MVSSHPNLSLMVCINFLSQGVDYNQTYNHELFHTYLFLEGIVPPALLDSVVSILYGFCVIIYCMLSDCV